MGTGGAVLLALAVSGCMGSKPRIASLPPAQTAPVRTAELPPPPTVEPPAPISEEPLPGEQVAAATVPPEASALEIGRADLLGGWAIASGGETCQLFMSLTTWTGGYRASTRGCNGPALSGISAWDLNGKTVTLKGGEGAAPVASLVATNPQTFNGATSDGAAITVSR
ncbi:MAG: AprI/Inh family metalloprotease inhibitor [Pseudomonadota bacterium]